MELDISGFPIVRLKYAEVAKKEAIQKVFETYLWLLQREEKFVVIADVFPNQKQGQQESTEDRRQAALFAKAHKEEMRRWVKGHLQVTANAAEQNEVREFAPMFEKFWGYPMFVVSSEQQAQQMALMLLA